MGTSSSDYMGSGAMSTINHRVYIRHEQQYLVSTLEKPEPTESELEITAEAMVLTDAVEEALSRMPANLYYAIASVILHAEGYTPTRKSGGPSGRTEKG